MLVVVMLNVVAQFRTILLKFFTAVKHNLTSDQYYKSFTIVVTVQL
jgi:hypothetical protein